MFLYQNILELGICAFEYKSALYYNCLPDIKHGTKRY